MAGFSLTAAPPRPRRDFEAHSPCHHRTAVCLYARRLGVAPARDVVAQSSSISSLRTLQDTRTEALSPSRNWFVESVPSIVSRIAGGTSSLHVVHSRSKGAPQVFHSDLTVHESPAQVRTRPQRSYGARMQSSMLPELVAQAGRRKAASGSDPLPPPTLMCARSPGESAPRASAKSKRMALC